MTKFWTIWYIVKDLYDGTFLIKNCNSLTYTWIAEHFRTLQNKEEYLFRGRTNDFLVGFLINRVQIMTQIDRNEFELVSSQY